MDISEQEVGRPSNEGSHKKTMLYSLIPCQSIRQSRAAEFGDLRGSSSNVGQVQA